MATLPGTYNQVTVDKNGFVVAGANVSGSGSSAVTSVNGRTGAVTGLAEASGNLSQFAATTSAQLAGVLSDETGTGSAVFNTNPTLTTASTSTVPLTINALAGQTSNIVAINTVDYGSNTLTIDSAGNVATQGGMAASSGTIQGRTISAGTGGVTSTGIGIFYNTLTSAYNDFGTIAVGQNLTFNLYNIVRFTPSGSFTVTSTVPSAGTFCSLIVLTSGTTTRTVTFGSGFKTGTTTLVTGTVTAKYFVIQYVSDGSFLIETSRTVAI
jgi:hypothetical protein